MQICTTHTHKEDMHCPNVVNKSESETKRRRDSQIEVKEKNRKPIMTIAITAEATAVTAKTELTCKWQKEHAEIISCSKHYIN